MYIIRKIANKEGYRIIHKETNKFYMLCRTREDAERRLSILNEYTVSAKEINEDMFKIPEDDFALITIVI